MSTWDPVERAVAMWSSGDYDRIAPLTDPAAAAVADQLGRLDGMPVLDVAAGTGNVALRLAQAGAEVTATDLTPEMLRRGRERTERAGVDVAWQHADAQALPYGDDAFAVVTSVFGAMFAAEPERAAAELARVTRPGGRIVLASWTPDGFPGRNMTLGLAAGGAPPGTPTPAERWGEAEAVRTLLAPHAERIEISEHDAPWRAASLDALLSLLDEASGPNQSLKASLDDAGWTVYASAVREVAERYAEPDVDGVVLRASYLLVVAEVS